MGARLPPAVVVTAAHPVQGPIEDQPDGGVDPGLERADRSGDHLGGHARGRVQRGGRDAGAGQFFGEIEGEHDLRQLALAVGLPAAVGAGEHDVVEIDRSLARGAHLHDPGRCGGLQGGQQQPDEQEAGEIVDREAQLDPVSAFLPPADRILAADPGVADQGVQPRGVGGDSGGQPADLIEVCKVGPVPP